MVRLSKGAKNSSHFYNGKYNSRGKRLMSKLGIKNNSRIKKIFDKIEHERINKSKHSE